MATKQTNTFDWIVIVLALVNIGVILYSLWRPIDPILKTVSAIVTPLLLICVLWVNHKRKKQAQKNA